MATYSAAVAESSLPAVKELPVPYPPEKKKRMEKLPKNHADRLARNRARRKAIKAGKAKRGDGKDVHHKDGNPMNNKDDNLEAIAASTNRAEASDSLKKKRNEALGNSVKA